MKEKQGKRELKLTAQQEKAIIALLECTSVREAAKQSNTSETTLFRWLSAEDFQSALNKARQTVWEDSIGRLRGGWSKALDTLLECMSSTAKDSDRIRAAATWCDIHFKAQNAHATEERIKQLESQLAQVLSLLEQNQNAAK